MNGRWAREVETCLCIIARRESDGKVAAVLNGSAWLGKARGCYLGPNREESQCWKDISCETADMKTGGGSPI